MGLFGSLLKLGATIGASAIPGVGAIAGPAVGAALGGSAGGPGLLTRGLGAAASAGIGAGFDKLGGALGGDKLAAGGGLENFANEYSPSQAISGQFDISQLAPDDMLGKISVLDLLKEQNGGFGGGL